MRGNGILMLVLALAAIAVACLVLSGDDRILGLESGRFASLAYLGIFGLVVASGLLRGPRGGGARALGAALAWALAFLVLVVGYSYREEMAGLYERVMGELRPGRPVALGTAGGRQVMVRRGGDEHFHVEASVEGRTLAFLVDTGASLVALDRDAAEALGIDTARLRYTSRVMTANGVAGAAEIRLGTVKIGGIVRQGVAAAVMERRGEGLSLLGMSFLGTLSSMEFRGDRLILRD